MADRGAEEVVPFPVSEDTERCLRAVRDHVRWTLGQLFPNDVTGAADAAFQAAVVGLRSNPVAQRMEAMGMERADEFYEGQDEHLRAVWAPTWKERRV